MTEVKQQTKYFEKQEIYEVNDIEHSLESEILNFVTPTPAEEKAVMWKLDRRIIPFLGLLYLCSFLDRVNIGNAKLAGITTDLGISSGDYNIALSLFFVGYVSLINNECINADTLIY